MMATKLRPPIPHRSSPLLFFLEDEDTEDTCLTPLLNKCKCGRRAKQSTMNESLLSMLLLPISLHPPFKHTREEYHSKISNVLKGNCYEDCREVFLSVVEK